MPGGRAFGSRCSNFKKGFSFSPRPYRNWGGTNIWFESVMILFTPTPSKIKERRIDIIFPLNIKTGRWEGICLSLSNLRTASLFLAIVFGIGVGQVYLLCGSIEGHERIFKTAFFFAEFLLCNLWTAIICGPPQNTSGRFFLSRRRLRWRIKFCCV